MPGSSVIIMSKEYIDDEDSIVVVPWMPCSTLRSRIESLPLALRDKMNPTTALFIHSSKSEVEYLTHVYATAPSINGEKAFIELLRLAKSGWCTAQHLDLGELMDSGFCQRVVELMCCIKGLFGIPFVTVSVQKYISKRGLKRIRKSKCAICGVRKRNRILYKCRNCEAHRYCSRKCQKIDWKGGHSSICEAIRQQLLNWK